MLDHIGALRENDFQCFCGVLLSADDPSFQAVNGAGGDMGNDGFLVAADTLFQAYAPKKEVSAKLRRKIDDSIAKAAALRATSFPSLARIVLLTPFDLTHEMHTYLRDTSRRAKLTAESWGEAKLTSILARNPGVRATFPEYLVPDVVREVRNLRQVVEGQGRPTLTLQAVAFEDVARFVNKLIWFWQDAYQQSVPGARPTSIAELLSEPCLRKLAFYLHLDAEPPVTPQRNWWTWIEHHAMEMTELANTILQRHGATLEPDAYALVHRILGGYLKSDGHLRVIAAMRESDESEGVPRPRNLAHYWQPREGVFSPIVNLYAWSARRYEELQRAGATNLQALIAEPGGGPGTLCPPSMISPALLVEQVARHADWGRQHSFVVGRDPVVFRQVVPSKPTRGGS